MRAYLTLFMLVALFSSVEMVQVNVTQGALLGETKTTIVGNQTCYSFKGIPYAAPPTGSLRFKSPQPPSNWTEVRNATSYGSVCPQIDLFTKENIPGSEDCLFLNVFSLNLSPSILRPVIVYIHGGGFNSGAGSYYEPDFLVIHDIVIVTINYRLGALGFLSMGTEEVPGNAGLKDQVAALKWVKENIAVFGGDPDNVTIMGQSAGAASVTYHLVSPLSKGFFKRIIALSGTGTCGFVKEFQSKDRAFLLGEQTGLYTTNTTELLNHLQNVTVDFLYNTNCTVALSELQYNNDLHTYQFVPVVEQCSNNDTFLSQDFVEILRNGSINEADMMIGFTSHETVTIVNELNSTYLKAYERNSEMFVPTELYYNNIPAVNIDVGAMIQKQYFADARLDENVLSKFISCTSDASFTIPIMRFMNLLPSTCNNTFFYQFSMTSGLNVYGNQGNAYNYTGYVGHLDDLMYIFPNSFLNTSLLTENSTELTLSNQFCTLIANFAEYGNPTPSNCSSINTTWPQFDKTNQSYLEIGNTLTVNTKPKADVIGFWETIYELSGVEFY